MPTLPIEYQDQEWCEAADMTYDDYNEFCVTAQLRLQMVKEAARM